VWLCWRPDARVSILLLMSASARWNLTVSRRTDNAVRRLLARRGQAHKGSLSRFVEDAVRARILDEEAGRAKARNANVSPKAVETAIDEALEWARHT
jgi:hypothetical protein